MNHNGIQMIYTYSKLQSIFSTLSVAWMLCASAILADETTGNLVREANNELVKGNWKAASIVLEKIVERDPIGAPVNIPSWRQQIPFKRGWCALQLKDWKTAIQHFERSYKSYPERTTNPYHKLSLRGWADAAAGAGDHELAIELYKRYLSEASRTDWDNPFRAIPPNKR